MKNRDKDIGMKITVRKLNNHNPVGANAFGSLMAKVTVELIETRKRLSS
jgi:hypothetical protein